MPHFSDSPFQYANGHNEPCRSSQPMTRRSGLAVSELLNPVGPGSVHPGDDTAPGKATPPRAGSQGDGPMCSLNSHTYPGPEGSRTACGDWAGSRWLPPMMLSPPADSPAETPSCWGYDNAPGSGSSSSSSSSSIGGSAPSSFSVSRRVPDFDGLRRLPPPSSRPRSPISPPRSSFSFSTLGSAVTECPPAAPAGTPRPRNDSEESSSPSPREGHERRVHSHSTSRPRHNFPSEVLRVFLSKAEERILANDERCRITREEMREMEAQTGVELKKIETWYTNHRRRGYPQQMADVLHREAERQRKAYVAAMERRDQLKQAAANSSGASLEELGEAYKDLVAKKALLDKLVAWAEAADQRLTAHKNRTRGSGG